MQHALHEHVPKAGLYKHRQAVLDILVLASVAVSMSHRGALVAPPLGQHLNVLSLVMWLAPP